MTFFDMVAKHHGGENVDTVAKMVKTPLVVEHDTTTDGSFNKDVILFGAWSVMWHGPTINGHDIWSSSRLQGNREYWRFEKHAAQFRLLAAVYVVTLETGDRVRTRWIRDFFDYTWDGDALSPEDGEMGLAGDAGMDDGPRKPRPRLP